MTTAYTASNNVPFSALPNINGVVQKFSASTTNPADATFAPDGLAAAPVFGLGGLQLQGNEIVAGGIATVVSYIGPLLNSGALCWVLLECEGGAQQVANATQSQHAITKGQVETLLASVGSPGDIKYTAASVAPTGWLKANGAAVSRATYAALFAAIGTTYGAGDGSTTFGLPDLRGEFLRGFDDGRGVDNGRVLGSSQKGALLAYDTNLSGIPDGMWNLSTTQSTGPASQVAMGVDAYVTADYSNVNVGGVAPSTSQPLPNIGGNQGYTGVTRPRNVALLALIKY